MSRKRRQYGIREYDVVLRVAAFDAGARSPVCAARAMRGASRHRARAASERVALAAGAFMIVMFTNIIDERVFAHCASAFDDARVTPVEVVMPR